MKCARVLYLFILVTVSAGASAEVENVPEREMSSATAATGSSTKPSQSKDLSYVGCPNCLEWLRAHQSLVQAEYEKALETFPILAYSFAVLLNEYEYISEFGAGRHGSRAGASQARSVAEIVEPDEIWNWWYQERRDYLDRMSALLAEMPDDEEPQTIDPKWNYCNGIERDYLTAQNCVQNYLENPPQTEEQWADYQGCIDAIQAYLNARDFCEGYW